MRVGFVGIGVMGAPMAQNVLKGGHAVLVYDTNREAVEALVRAGAEGAANAKQLAAVCDVVITMLPTPAVVEAAVFGPDGIFEGAASGLVYIDMSTGEPALAQRLARALGARGVVVIDCPVGRTQAHAAAGTLLLMAGGDRAAIERARPVLMCMGKDLVYCGGPGMGQAMKLVNNMLASIVMQGTTEALTLGAKAGLSLETMLTVLTNTMARNAQLTDALPAKAFKGDFTPGFTVRLARKDVGLAVGMAQRLEVPVPLAALTLQLCSALVAGGYGGQDVGVILGAQADFLGVRIRLAE